MTISAELVSVITALEEHACRLPEFITITEPSVEVTDVVILANCLAFFLIINWSNDINDVVTSDVAGIF